MNNVVCSNLEEEMEDKITDYLRKNSDDVDDVIGKDVEMALDILIYQTLEEIQYLEKTLKLIVRLRLKNMIKKEQNYPNIRHGFFI